MSARQLYRGQMRAEDPALLVLHLDTDAAPAVDGPHDDAAPGRSDARADGLEAHTVAALELVGQCFRSYEAAGHVVCRACTTNLQASKGFCQGCANRPAWPRSGSGRGWFGATSANERGDPMARNPTGGRKRPARRAAPGTGKGAEVPAGAPARGRTAIKPAAGKAQTAEAPAKGGKSTSVTPKRRGARAAATRTGGQGTAAKGRTGAPKEQRRSPPPRPGQGRPVPRAGRPRAPPRRGRGALLRPGARQPRAVRLPARSAEQQRRSQRQGRRLPRPAGPEPRAERQRALPPPRGRAVRRRQTQSRGPPERAPQRRDVAGHRTSGRRA